MNGDGAIGSHRIENAPDEDGPSGAPDCIGGPGKCVESREALEAEITPEKIGRNIAFAAHAESDEASRK